MRSPDRVRFCKFKMKPSAPLMSSAWSLFEIRARSASLTRSASKRIQMSAYFVLIYSNTIGERNSYQHCSYWEASKANLLDAIRSPLWTVFDFLRQNKIFFALPCIVSAVEGPLNASYRRQLYFRLKFQPGRQPSTSVPFPFFIPFFAYVIECRKATLK